MSSFLVVYECVSAHFPKTVELELRHAPRSVLRFDFMRLCRCLGKPDEVQQTEDEDLGNRIRRTGEKLIRKRAISIPPVNEFALQNFDIAANVEEPLEMLPDDIEVVSKRFKMRMVYVRPGHQIHMSQVVWRRPEKEDVTLWEVEVELDCCNMLFNQVQIMETVQRLNEILSSRGVLASTVTLQREFKNFVTDPWRLLTWSDLQWGNGIFSWDKTLMHTNVSAGVRMMVYYVGRTGTIYYSVSRNAVYRCDVKNPGTSSFVLVGVRHDSQRFTVLDVPYYREWSGDDLKHRLASHPGSIAHVMPWKLDWADWENLHEAQATDLPRKQAQPALDKLMAVAKPGLIIAHSRLTWQNFIGMSPVAYLYIPCQAPKVTLRAFSVNNNTGVALFARSGIPPEFKENHMRLPASTYHMRSFTRVGPPAAHFCQAHLDYSVTFVHGGLVFVDGSLAVASNDMYDNGPDTIHDAQDALTMSICPMTSKNILAYGTMMYCQEEMRRIAGGLGGAWTLAENMLRTLVHATQASERMISMSLLEGPRVQLVALPNATIPEHHAVHQSWPFNTNHFIPVQDMSKLENMSIHLLVKH